MNTQHKFKQWVSKLNKYSGAISLPAVSFKSTTNIQGRNNSQSIYLIHSWEKEKKNKCLLLIQNGNVLWSRCRALSVPLDTSCNAEAPSSSSGSSGNGASSALRRIVPFVRDYQQGLERDTSRAGMIITRSRSKPLHVGTCFRSHRHCLNCAVNQHEVEDRWATAEQTVLVSGDTVYYQLQPNDF